MAESMIIIGGGLAGLSAGCYARMNGFETKIFEHHSIPGGVCTAWKREGSFLGSTLPISASRRDSRRIALWPAASPHAFPNASSASPCPNPSAFTAIGPGRCS